MQVAVGPPLLHMLRWGCCTAGAETAQRPTVQRPGAAVVLHQWLSQGAPACQRSHALFLVSRPPPPPTQVVHEAVQEAVHDAVVQAIEENASFDVRANLYTLIAVTGVVLYWRGVWNTW